MKKKDIPQNDNFHLSARINSKGKTISFRHMIAIDRPSGATGATEEAESDRERVSAHSDEFTGATNVV